MKFYLQIVFCIISFIFLPMSSYADTASRVTANGIEYENIQKEKIYMYPPIEDIGLGVHYEINSVNIDWIKGGSYTHLNELKSALIQFIFGTDCGNLNSCLDQFLKAGDEGYTKIVNKVPANSIEYYSKIEGNNIRYTRRVLVYRLYDESYSGGAHGAYSTRYFNYDLLNNKELTLQNLFIPNCEKQILKVICHNLCKKYKAKSTVELNAKRHIDPGQTKIADNFFLNNDGITFVYHPYSIAPFSEGEIMIKVPLSELREYLTKDGKALF